MRNSYLIAAFLCTLATETAACSLDASFFRASDNDQLIDCLQGAGGEAFVSGRAANLATVLHLAVEADADPVVLDAIRRAAGDGWPALRDRVDREGRTALHVATDTAKHADSVRWLLNWGADPNSMYSVEGRWNPARWDYGITPLHLAASRSDGADFVSALLASGADPEIRRPPASEGWTAVLIAGRHAEDLRVLTALAAGGADLTAVSSDKNNGLHVAAGWDRPTPIVRFLLERGVDADGTNDDDQTPLHLAARFSSDEASVALLLDTASDPCVEDSRGHTARDLLAGSDSLAEDGELQRRFHEICVEGN